MNAIRLLAPILLASATAAAGNDELSLGVANRALRTSSANAVSDKGLVSGALAYGRQLGLALAPDLGLWLEGSFTWGAVDGTVFRTMSTEVDTLGFSAGARISYPVFRHIPGVSGAPLLRHIHATGRIALGTGRAALAIRDDSGHGVSDAGWGAISEAAVGLDLVGPPHQDFSFGLRFELGAAIASSIPLQAASEGGNGQMLVLGGSAAPLGGLDLSGPFVLLSALGQF
jgi:hypothetical protein